MPKPLTPHRDSNPRVQDLIITAPSVVYRCGMNDGSVIEVANPSVMPDGALRQWIEEPFVKVEMITPKDFVGSLMEVSAQIPHGSYGAC